MVVNELHGRHIPKWYGASAPHYILRARLNHHLGFLYGQKPVLVQAFIAKLAVEAFNTRVLDRLSLLDEVQPHPVLIGLRIQRHP